MSSLRASDGTGKTGQGRLLCFLCKCCEVHTNRRTDRTAVTTFRMKKFVVEIPLFIFRAAWESVWLFDGSRGCHWESCNQQRPITPNSPKKHKSTKSCFNGFNWNQNGLQRTPVRVVQLSSNSNLKEPSTNFCVRGNSCKSIDCCWLLIESLTVHLIQHLQ